MFDAFELNKIIGAILFSLLLIFGVGIVSDVIFHVEKPAKPGYPVETAGEAPAGEAKPAQAAAEAPLAQRLAQADVKKGEAITRKCASCHTFDAGGPNRVGPNLHGVAGRKVASHEGFAYSSAMKDKGGTWTYAELDHFLAGPKKYVPGTAMGFAGISKPQDRADVIAYLKSISPNAPPLPQPQAQAQAMAQPAEKPAEKPQPTPQMAPQQPASEPQEQAAQPQPEPQQMAETAPPAKAEAQLETQDGSLAKRLADASAEKGQKVARKCAACHTFNEGGPNRVGPNLHGVVGRKVASHEGFSYSSAMKDKGGTWTYAELDHFLTAPRKYVPGTAMGFAGIRKPEDRTDLIAYLKSISPDAPPLPQ